MKDAPPRDVRFQVNDHGATYIGNGKVLVFAREFRNDIAPNPWYRRLVYNLYDLSTDKWVQKPGYYVGWSSMDPNDPNAVFNGIDGTPDVFALRDPETDQYILFLFHQYTLSDGTGTMGITGLQIDAQQNIVLDPSYPSQSSFTNSHAPIIYGTRVLFDNGIYYMHYNSDSTQIVNDWPDQLALAASLHPYTQPWVNSADNSNPNRPYFQRGGEYDCDNAAIWSGQIFKHRGKYYLYYEAFHAIDDVNVPYQDYDALQTGSCLGYATAN